MKTQEKNGGMEQIAGGIHWPTHTGIPRVPVRLQSLVSIAINQKLTTMENQIQQQWSFHPEKIAESSWRGCSKLVKQSRNHAEHPHSQHGSAGLRPAETLYLGPWQFQIANGTPMKTIRSEICFLGELATYLRGTWFLVISIRFHVLKSLDEANIFIIFMQK